MAGGIQLGTMDRLTQAGFDLLLASLDSDRQEAGGKYELLRRKLLKFFECRGCLVPEGAADETINRIAKNLESGQEIRNVAAYALGIAHNVLHEVLRSQRQDELTEDLPAASAAPDEEAEHRIECLESCLRELAPGEANLVLRYYASDTPTHIAARKKLAEELGIPLNALRIRTHRIRARLERCVERRMNETRR